MNNDIKSSIIYTLSFFDIFEIPLTPIELHCRVSVKCNFEEMMKVLESMNEIETKEGLWFLKGKESHIDFRKKQYILSQEKWKIAKRACKILRFIPGVKMVAVCNNFSYKESSDIDVFIVTKKERIWLTRFLVTASTHLAGIRRHGNKIKSRICLSFYVSEDGINLESLLLKNEDPYFVYWMADLMPLYNDKTLDKFYKANAWFDGVLPNFEPTLVSQRIRVEDNVFSLVCKRVANVFLFSFLEKFFKYFQLKKMQRNYLSKAKENDTRVVISDTVLKFHEEDRREFYKNKLNEKIAEYN